MSGANSITNMPQVREAVFLMLYQMEVGDTPFEEVVEMNAQEYEFKNNKKISSMVEGILSHQDEINEFIQKYSPKRALSRIAKINVIIMSIAIYEMIYSEKVPPKVAINEGIELGKKFSHPVDASFINGVLNSFYNNELKEKNTDE